MKYFRDFARFLCDGHLLKTKMGCFVTHLKYIRLELGSNEAFYMVMGVGAFNGMQVSSKCMLLTRIWG